MIEVPRTCVNCGYRRGLMQFGKCLLTGAYVDLGREYLDKRCDSNFSGWVPRPSIFARIFMAPKQRQGDPNASR